MAKKKTNGTQYRFTVGGNLADGARFEAGEAVPADLAQNELDALIEMNAVEQVEAE